DDVLFDAEIWKEKTVNDVLRRQGELHNATDRNVEFVNFTIAFRVLDFPHPLLADDVDFEGVGRWAFDCEVEVRAPGEHTHHQEQGNDGPSEFEGHLRKTRRSTISWLAATIFEDEINDRKSDEDQHERADSGEGPIEVIDLAGYLRSVLWENGKFHG